MYKKRGQVTIFIIIGLVLLLSIGLFMYYGSLKSIEKPSLPTEIDAASLTAYVESCLDATAAEIIPIIAAQGGIYEPTFYKTYKGTNISYWCYALENNQCVNAMVTKDDIAQQIIYSLEQELPRCMNFAGFEQQGYAVQEGVMQGAAVIASDNVEIEVYYPIKLKKGNQEIVVDRFSTSIATPLGELYAIGQDIINQEATTNQFNAVEWQTDHVDIKIIKTRPYPSVIYAIQKNNLELQFAVQGISTVDNPGELVFGEPNYGCCYAAGQCYANTPSTTCTTKQGVYEAACTCEEIIEIQTVKECTGDACNDCGAYRHGESWCGYEGDVGQGQDAAGSRHHLYSCFDGEVRIESCRDYREEICVEQEIAGTSEAVCRANRWQDCTSCLTEDCCENTNERDCYWDPDLRELETTQCIPAVPPGLKFWEFTGFEICSRANQEKMCSGLHCSQEWVDATAISCFSQADCGNYVNAVGIMTESGFLNSDLTYEPQEEIYETKQTTVNLPLVVDSQQQLLDSPVEEAVDSFIAMVTAAYRFVNQWTDITVPNYLNPFTPQPKIEIMDVSFCAPWQAPNTDQYCDRCEEDAIPCTEYRCHSLGKKCVYEEINGYGMCTVLPYDKEQVSFTITLNKEIIPSTYDIEETTLAIEDKVYNGYTIRPALTPYKPFTLGVTTTTDTICRLDYTPQAEYIDAPLLVIGSATFQREHEIVMQIPPRVIIPQRLKDGLNVTTAEQIVDALTKPKDMLEQYEEKFPAIFSTYKAVTGDDLEDELNPYVDDILDLIDDVEDNYPYYENLSITLLDKFDNGGYYLFISCEDRYGNAQEEELVLDITIADSDEDTAPPTILMFNPENKAYIGADAATTQVTIYTDEPATCRYAKESKAYAGMEYSFTCNNNIYDLTSVAGGSYKCTTTLETAEETTVSIACADNPDNSETYKIQLQQSTTVGIDGQLYSEYIPEDIENPVEEYAEYISVTTDNITTTITATSYLLSDIYATVFNTTTQNTTLNLFIDEDMSCAISDQTTQAARTKMNCTTSAEEQKGRYLCTTTITFSSYNETNGNTNSSTAYEISCENEQHANVNEEPVEYTLKKSNALQITAISPGNNEETEQDTALTVVTSASEDVRCGYAEHGSIEFLQMTKMEDTLFTTTLYDLDVGYNIYIIYCTDAYGNTAEETVSLYVI